MGEGYVSTAFKLLVSPLKVGRHKRTGRGGPVEQDGLISSILILVYLVGLSVSVIISQFLSSERVVTGHQVQPFVTQLFLILLLIPGVATIAYAFKYRGYIRTVIHHPHTMSYPEIINMAGLYIFASCAIAFDLFSVICEFNCLHSNIADGVVDIIFYISKAMFTLLQCLFIRKFLKSCFDSKPFLQVSLVSIIAANMAIWMYTTIEEHSLDFFGHIYDNSTDPWIASSQPSCSDPNLQELHDILLSYFSPFTLEFSLLVFEHIIGIWSQMTHLDHVDNIPDDAILNNIQLNRVQYEIEGKNNSHRRLRTKLSTSQRRIWLWIEQLYKKMATGVDPESRGIIDQCYNYHTSLQKAIETLDSTMKKEGAALQDVQELQKLNDCAEKMQPFQREGSEMLQTIVASHRINVERKRETLRVNLRTAVASINGDEADLMQHKDTLQQEKSNLAQPYRTGRNCGLGCSGGLLLGIFLFSIGMVLVISQHQNGSNFTSYDCSGEDNSEGTELFKYSLLISLFMVFVNFVHLLLTFYGFKALLGLKSNYQKFRFTDVFYCLSCIGSIILLSFSIVSAIAVIVPDARFYNWEVNRQMFNSTVRVLELDTRCATSVATGTSWANLFYITTDIVQIFVCSAFVVQAGQMLPHGNVSKNKKLNEIIQFLGITHFFLWIVTSFIYAPNLDQFYFVEELYFGASTFAVIARVTYPFIIFYHFTTAMRCIALFYQYDSLP